MKKYLIGFFLLISTFNCYTNVFHTAIHHIRGIFTKTPPIRSTIAPKTQPNRTTTDKNPPPPATHIPTSLTIATDTNQPPVYENNIIYTERLGKHTAYNLELGPRETCFVMLPPSSSACARVTESSQCHRYSIKSDKNYEQFPAKIVPTTDSRTFAWVVNTTLNNKSTGSYLCIRDNYYWFDDTGHGRNYQLHQSGSDVFFNLEVTFNPHKKTVFQPSTVYMLLDRNNMPEIEDPVGTILTEKIPYNAIYTTVLPIKKSLYLQLPLTTAATSIPYTKSNPQDPDLILTYDPTTHSFKIKAPYVSNKTTYRLNCSFLYEKQPDRTFIDLVVNPLFAVSSKECPSVETDFRTYNIDSIPVASVYTTAVHYEDTITLTTLNNSTQYPVYLKSSPSLPDLQFRTDRDKITFSIPETTLPATYTIDCDSLGTQKNNMISFTITNEINLLTINNPQNPIHGKNIIALNNHQTFTIKARRGDSLSFSYPLDPAEQQANIPFDKYKASVIGSENAVKEVVTRGSNHTIFTITIPSNITIPATYSVNFIVETWKRSNLKNKMLLFLKSNTVKVADIVIE